MTEGAKRQIRDQERAAPLKGSLGLGIAGSGSGSGSGSDRGGAGLWGSSVALLNGRSGTPKAGRHWTARVTINQSARWRWIERHSAPILCLCESTRNDGSIADRGLAGSRPSAGAQAQVRPISSWLHFPQRELPPDLRRAQAEWARRPAALRAATRRRLGCLLGLEPRIYVIGANVYS